MPANFTGSLAISGSLLLTGSITTTGGITISGSIDSASFAATASSADNFVVRQNLTGSNVLATGTITAQTLVVQTVTSSIVYSSGSNIFGNQLTDIQQLTGSVRVTGSFNTIGNACITSVCSPAIVGGTVSGTTIYGSTAICGAVICGGATTLTGALSGTSATFTNASGAFIGVTVTTTDTTGSARIRATSTGGNITDLISYSASHASRANQAWIGGDGSSTITVLQAGGTEFMRGSSTGAATFSSSVTASGDILANGSSIFTKAASGGYQISLNAQLSTQKFRFDDLTGGAYGVLAFEAGNGTGGFIERMRIDSSGNVGIGYTPCTSYGPLQVKSPASSYTVDLVGRTAGLNGESQITFWNSGQTVVQGAIGNIARCMVFYAGGTEVMRMTCAGNVGIGTTSPNTTLTVSGSGANGINLGISTNQSTNSSRLFFQNTTTTFAILNNGDNLSFFSCGTIGSDTGTERMRITSGGIACFSSTVCTPQLVSSILNLTPNTSNIFTYSAGGVGTFNIDIAAISGLTVPGNYQTADIYFQAGLYPGSTTVNGRIGIVGRGGVNASNLYAITCVGGIGTLTITPYGNGTSTFGVCLASNCTGSTVYWKAIVMSMSV